MDCKRDFKIRVTKALENLAALDKVWKNKAISLGMKKIVLVICIFSSFLSGCATWTKYKRLGKESTCF